MLPSSRTAVGFAAFAFAVAIPLGFTRSVSANPLPTVPAPGGGSCAVLSRDLALPGLWLGHFSGGRFLYETSGRVLDWHDQYSCFPGRIACNRWQRAMHRRYRQVTGYTTCLPLR